MKKLILIGRTESGKTTLCQKLHDIKIEYKKTQAVEGYENAIDTPGEYIENRFYYQALMVTSADADVIGLVQDVTDDRSYFPPGFGASFSKPIIGILTKVDLVDDEDILKEREQYLIDAGAEKIFRVSPKEDIGTQELEKFLNGI
ncbi:EutP/PduV family microcompartment system protein [Clostridium hydrogeniformans]|uniref:EutP/PduV family microcompartment system protein n=1 Tax=Clostridium hydrogeniformans TaxID=349933 RepID=UPI0004849CBB|nr:EutP/PduV family microcompartment system protein [Clostridium hydrogeniformans]